MVVAGGLPALVVVDTAAGRFVVAVVAGGFKVVMVGTAVGCFDVVVVDDAVAAGPAVVDDVTLAGGRRPPHVEDPASVKVFPASGTKSQS